MNESMPGRAVDSLSGHLDGVAGKRIAVLGVAYRGGVKETAFSGALALRDVLQERGAVALAHDPMYSHEELRALGFEPYDLGEPCDGAIVQADHGSYRTLTAADLPGASVVFDGRRILDESNFVDVAIEAFGRPSDPTARR